MKRFIVCSVLALMALPLYGQRLKGSIETDIFGDLRFRSYDPGYTAALKKNIFDDLTFTDDRSNEIVFEKKYLDREYPEVVGNEDARREFFRSVINRHRRDEGYEATFKVDIFGSVITEDNRGNRTEEKTDIFGYKSYEETRGGREISIGRDLHGDLQYRSGSTTASLGKTFTGGRWVYADSGGNRFEFGQTTWNEMIRRHGDDERVFMFLIDGFLRN